MHITQHFIHPISQFSQTARLKLCQSSLGYRNINGSIRNYQERPMSCIFITFRHIFQTIYNRTPKNSEYCSRIEFEDELFDQEGIREHFYSWISFGLGRTFESICIEKLLNELCALLVVKQMVLVLFHGNIQNFTLHSNF